MKRPGTKSEPDVSYRLSLAARRDLRWIYTDSEARFGGAQADRYIAGLRSALMFLADNPRAARERPEFEPPVRVHRCGAHVIIYAVDETGVFVVRIRHGREDWAAAPGGD